MNDVVKTYRIQELNRAIKDIIETSCPYPIWVQGEISDFDKNRKKENIYFQLSEKDSNKNENISSIKCVLYYSQKQIIRLRMKEAGMKVEKMDGLDVRFQVRFSVSVRYGGYSLIIQDIDPSFTMGKLAQSRQGTIDWLRKRNLIERNKKTDLVPVPLNIGLITNEGEGYHDFVAKLRQSGFSFNVFFWHSSVQGPRTEKEVTAGLDYFGENKDQIDVVVLVRGGGSSTDLSWFDSRLIAEKIAFSPKPVLTGIGHFTNISVADMVANHYLATPTATAEFIIERINKFEIELEKLARSINQNSLHVGDLAKYKTEALIGAMKTGAEYIIKEGRQEIAILSERCLIQFNESIGQQIKQIDLLRGKLTLLDPKNIMKRGFSITRLKGQALKSVYSLRQGDELTTIFFKGEAKSLVEKININKNDSK